MENHVWHHRRGVGNQYWIIMFRCDIRIKLRSRIYGQNNQIHIYVNHSIKNVFNLSIYLFLYCIFGAFMNLSTLHTFIALADRVCWGWHVQCVWSTAKCASSLRVWIYFSFRAKINRAHNNNASNKKPEPKIIKDRVKWAVKYSAFETTHLHICVHCTVCNVHCTSIKCWCKHVCKTERKIPSERRKKNTRKKNQLSTASATKRR